MLLTVMKKTLQNLSSANATLQKTPPPVGEAVALISVAPHVIKDGYDISLLDIVITFAADRCMISFFCPTQQ